MKVIDSNFYIIDVDDFFNVKEFNDWTYYSTFSIVYLLEYNVYINIMNVISKPLKILDFLINKFIIWLNLSII